jgi:hypothetical protein
MKTFYWIYVFLALPILSDAQGDWYLNFSPGISYISPMPLVINNSGVLPISFWANYKSAPLQSPFYYSCRVGFKKELKGWEAELNHLKIYLKNKPDEIQRFSISHGYNQFFINRVKKVGKFGVKKGIGVVIAHPENTIRNLKLDENSGIFGEGYYFAGPAFKYGFFRELSISKRFYFLVETCMTIAYANVPVVKGSAHVPVMAFHLQLGPGYYLKKTGSQINETLFK